MMIHRFYYCFLLLFVLFCFTGCFELVEKIKINPNGSGSATYTLNMSMSKTKLNTVMKMKTVNGRKVPSKTEVQKKVKEMEAKIKQTAGISNVKTNLDFSNYIAELSLDFKHPNHLNSVVKTFKTNGMIGKEFPTDFYAYSSKQKKFIKKNSLNLKEKYRQISSADKQILNNAKYIAITQFSVPIAKQSNPHAKTSKSKKASMFSTLISDLIFNKKTINNAINLQ